MTDNNIQGKVLFPLLNLSRRSLKGEDGTPPLFSKPFPGIYLFALQIDKCHSSFKKVPIQKLIIKIFTDLPVLGTEPTVKSISRSRLPRSPHLLWVHPDVRHGRRF